MPVDMSLFLQNVHAALVNQQYEHARFLLDYAIKLETDGSCSPHQSPLDISIGLHPGRVRDANEDCILAINGIFAETHRFGLYVVCDGMGGHHHGQEAASLAIQTLLEYLLPRIISYPITARWERLLVDGIHQANRAIYLRNQSREQQSVARRVPVNTSQIHSMGTTLTAVLLVDETAYIANVGDSRTYLYDQSLQRITNDHSLVAAFLADGRLQQEEGIYLHPPRNQITRALGTQSIVEVDTFVVPLHGNEILLLCSDGLWEMTRDRKIEEILASSWANASSMTNQLVQLATTGGGTDNIGCIVVQLQKRRDVSTMKTALLDPVGGTHTIGHLLLNVLPDQSAKGECLFT